MAELGSFTSRAHAEMAAGMLDAHGIEARVLADDAGGAVPHVAVGMHGYRVLVADRDADVASDLLAGDGDTVSDTADARVGMLFRKAPMRLLVGILVGIVLVGIVLAEVV